MSNEKKTTKELIADVFDSAPKEPNAFEIFDDPKPAQKGNDPIPTAIPAATATWNPDIARTIFGDPTHNWTITSINTIAMPMAPVNMQFNLNCIKKGDKVVVTICHYDDARVVSQATLNGEISEITPERMVISVVNPISSDNTEIILTPADMIDNSRSKYTITCGNVYYYPNTFGMGMNYNDRTTPWNPAVPQSGF